MSVKRAVYFLLAALFILLVIQPNLTAHPDEPQPKIPEISDQIKTNVDAAKKLCQSQAVIAIDPGRGGSDTGYLPADGSSEKDISMQLAAALGDSLENAGYKVVYTRWYDDIPEFETEAASDAWRLEQAKNQGANYIISLRFNQDQPLHKGFSLFTQPNNESVDALAKQIAQRIQATNYSQYEGLDTDHYANFGMLTNADQPAILIQMGYLSNEDDLSKLEDPNFQKTIADCITQAFLDTIN